jgi:hypothetical protein
MCSIILIYIIVAAIIAFGAAIIIRNAYAGQPNSVTQLSALSVYSMTIIVRAIN